ncbi:unnamed protein product [Urochloa humidicola]
MAAASSAAVLKIAVVAACIAVALLSMGAPAMADLQDDCRTICRPICDGFSSDVCNAVIDIAPILKTLNFFFTTCKVRVSGLCTPLCVNTCSLNTVTPAPPSSPPPPPCKP